MRRLAVLLFGALLALASFGDAEVWYVPGWLRCHGADGLAWNSLTNVFREARASCHDWDGNRSWGASVRNADLEAEALARRIAALPESSRTNLTVVGHSLGGRIVVKALARLSEQHVQVGQGVALAAAIPADDPALGYAGAASLRPLVLMANPRDLTLLYAYRASPGVKTHALGLVGPAASCPHSTVVMVPRETTRETEVAALWGKFALFRDLAAHHAVFYLSELEKSKEEVLR